MHDIKIKYDAGDFDVIVVGAGHAGCEAALAAARKGLKTMLATLNLEALAMMPCNPSIGGTGKGHLVREIDALGGEMGKAIDETYLQIKTLNTSKGPAVHSLRAQADKQAYHERMKQVIERTPNLWLVQQQVAALIVNDGVIGGVETFTGGIYHAKAVVLATGVYLKGRIIIGESSESGGPNGTRAAMYLSDSLAELGFTIIRLKTGTPPRINKRSIDFSVMSPQYGENDPEAFSFGDNIRGAKNVPCYLAYTNEKTHELIRANLSRSPLFSGQIHGVGPRYCPSIEDKVVRFAEKERHQLFIEPEGEGTDEMYLQGLSSSLPEDVQAAFIHTVHGLEHAEVMRSAYAIEYDAIDPQQINASLETKLIRGLFTAGQINGTSGYEEAAAQGIVAGINAAQYVSGGEYLILDRASSYIGVLIDDIVTKGTSEPYRIMTSRVEYRLTLRQDNADLRLMPLGHKFGLIGDERYEKLLRKQEQISAEKKRLKSVKLLPGALADSVTDAAGTAALTEAESLYMLLKRPQLSYASLADADPERPELPPDVTQQAELQIKYEDYIIKQQAQIDRFRRMEAKVIPPQTDYASMKNLRLEARQKLDKLRPANLGQASRISGVSPADINVLMVELSKRKQQ